MTSRVVNVSTFYATEDGVIYHPVSEEATKVNHDVEQARERLSNILKSRQKSRAKNNRAGGGRSKLTPVDNAAANTATAGDYVYPESGNEDEDEQGDEFDEDLEEEQGDDDDDDDDDEPGVASLVDAGDTELTAEEKDEQIIKTLNS